MNLHIPIILLFVQRHNVSVSFRRRQQQKKRNVRESNALLEPANPYSDRESAGVTYKMMELHHAGAIPPDMTSDIQAIELCAGPQCTACSLSQGFPCDPRDRNMYESPNFQNNQNAMRTFRATNRPTGLPANQEFPPPPVEVHQNCQHELDKCCILDLITSPSKGTPITTNPPGAPSGAGGMVPRASVKNTGAKQPENLPVDLTAPCDVR